MNSLFDYLSQDSLVWCEDRGVGYYEVNDNGVYDQAYFDRYRQLRDTPIGAALNAFRCSLAGRFNEPVIDVGIGDGAFVEAFEGAGGNVVGYDVNPAGITWLKERGSWGELYHHAWPVATFWDSLEHIRRPDKALARVGKYALISIPIFDGQEHVLNSKHFRRDEHYWYFTRAGFMRFLSEQGFVTDEVLLTESELGREGIETFIARRVG